FDAAGAPGVSIDLCTDERPGLEKGILQAPQDGEIVSLGIDFHVSQTRNKRGVFGAQIVLQISALYFQLEGVGVAPAADSFMAPAIAERRIRILELKLTVRGGGSKHQGNDVRAVGIEFGVAGEHRENVRVWLQSQHGTLASDSQ